MILVKRVLLFLLLTTVPATSHSWYPLDCCGGDDCHPVECHELTILDGPRVLYRAHAKVVIEFPPVTVRSSPDGSCHVCYQKNYYIPFCVFIRTSS